MKITANKIARQLLPLCDLPKEAQSDFDYIEQDSYYENRLVNYKGAWYDVYDTQVVTANNGAPMGWAFHVKPGEPLAKWDSVISESCFSGVVFKLAPDDYVICGRYST
jgi:hypothetical protein